MAITAREIAEFLAHRSLTKTHRQLAVRAANVIKGIEHVEAVLLKGSLARGTADVSSDIDLLITHRGDDTTRSIIDDQLVSRLEEMGDPVHRYRSLVNQIAFIAYFRPWIMAEFDIRSEDQARGNWKNGFSEVLFSRSDGAQMIIEAASSHVFQPSDFRAEFENLVTTLPILCIKIHGYYLRGEIITAFDELAWMRDRLLWVASVTLGIWNEGPRRAESRFPAEIVEAWWRCYPKTSEEVPSVLVSYLDWYLEWLVPKLETSGTSHAADLAETLREVIEDHL